MLSVLGRWWNLYMPINPSYSSSSIFLNNFSFFISGHLVVLRIHSCLCSGITHGRDYVEFESIMPSAYRLNNLFSPVLVFLNLGKSVQWQTLDVKYSHYFHAVIYISLLLIYFYTFSYLSYAYILIRVKSSILITISM